MPLVRRRPWLAGSLFLSLPALAGVAHAEAPSVEQALKLAPVQKNADYDRVTPDEAAKCTIKAEKIGGETGWVVRDPSGQMLRRFADTNGDNVVDLWCYYQNGIEVYRDIDSQKNGSKADQYRWLNTAGSRWGVDADENGVIDSWKLISAEEVTAEAVAALATGDAQRFGRLLLTKEELGSLGLGAERATELTARLTEAPKAFAEQAKAQKSLSAGTKWLHFGGSRPGVVPAGTDDSTADVVVYENVLAMVDTDGKDGQVQIGTLVRVGDNWRLIDSPTLPPPGEQLASTGFFFQPSLPPRTEGTTENMAGAPSDAVQKLLDRLQEIDDALAKAGTPEEQTKINEERTTILEQLADASTTPEDRAQWVRQLADTASAAVQAGSYAGGAERLKALSEKFAQSGDDDELAAYVEFRYLMADYGASVQQANVDFPAVQTKWLESLEKFVEAHPKSPDAAEAMLQLGIAQEYAGQDDQAKAWYQKIVTDFPSASNTAKAAGAARRLDSVGKPMTLRAKAFNVNGTVDLAAKPFKGNYVLVHYWATWCEPCKADLEEIQDLIARFGNRGGFTAVGVNLDSKPEEVTAFLKQNRLTWPQVFEAGGLDSRLANEMGILTLPTMILIDPKGNVVNRNAQLNDVEKLLKANAKQ
jgi:thiol-disulfide isomerase/thioredoxin